MNRKKLRVSLFNFLETGRFGPLVPSRSLSIERLTTLLGKPNYVYSGELRREIEAYEWGASECFPIIASYGVIEFHFDSPTTLGCIFCDTSFEMPIGNAWVKFVDVAVIKEGRKMSEFLRICRSRNLAISPARPYDPPYSLIVSTASGVDIGFQFEAPEENDLEATLTWFSYTPQ